MLPFVFVVRVRVTCTLLLEGGNNGAVLLGGLMAKRGWVQIEKGYGLSIYNSQTHRNGKGIAGD